MGGPELGLRDTVMMVIDPSIDSNTDYNAFEKKAYRVGGGGYEQIAKLYPTSDGGYIGGNYTTSTSITQSNNDGTSFKPPTTTIGNGSHHAYIVKFDKNGDTEKVLLFGDSTNQYHNSGEGINQIIETSSGEYLVVGQAEITDTVGTAAPGLDESRGKNVWVMKLDKNLTPVWSRSYGSSANDFGQCVVETANGFVIAGKAGTMDGEVTPKPGYSGDNAWVFMIDKDSGDIIWDEVHGGSSDDSFSFVFKDGNNDILLGGNSSSNNQDLADKNKGGRDVWFLKLNGQTGATAPPSSSNTSIGFSSPENPFLYLRVGPFCGNRFRIDYADMRTSAVFGENVVLNVMSQAGADEAMILCDRAIDYVSKQRVHYGGYQNALEHLYNSNANTAENTTASESRIADADIADEMVEFSCTKILEQVNHTVMSQANAANQTALQLLN